MIDFALELARAGAAVFPLRPCDKRPFAGTGGHRDATSDLDRVREWWKRTPRANIGLACAASGVFVLDVDPRNGGTLNGLPALPETLTAISGRGDGGQHFYFRAPAILTFKKTIGTGLDIKHEGYVLAPPSVHPDSRLPYTWHDPSVDIANAPAWLLDRAVKLHVPNAKASLDLESGYMYRLFAHAGMLVPDAEGNVPWIVPSGGCVVECPWSESHTSNSRSGTLVFPPREGESIGWFHCSHTSHGVPTQTEVIDSFPRNTRFAAVKL